MFARFLNNISMHLVCPECKNEVDLSTYGKVSKDQVVECNVCGISLLIITIEGEDVLAEVVDEGK